MLGGVCSEIFLGVTFSNKKPYSNENVWIPKQNLQIETEICKTKVDKFINRYVTVITMLDAV